MRSPRSEYIWASCHTKFGQEMDSYLLVIALAIISLAVAIAALILTIKGSKKMAGLGSEALLMEPSQENLVEVLEVRELPARRVNTLAEVAVLLRAEALMIFDDQGLVVETYNIAEEHGARAAASFAELVNFLKSLGFPTRVLIFGNSIISFIMELKRVGDVTLYSLVIGGPKLVTDTKYAREILQEYVESIIGRRR